jgi:hypothetical protein
MEGGNRDKKRERFGRARSNGESRENEGEGREEREKEWERILGHEKMGKER